jgi:hypothetical protein
MSALEFDENYWRSPTMDLTEKRILLQDHVVNADTESLCLCYSELIKNV